MNIYERLEEYKKNSPAALDNALSEYGQTSIDAAKVAKDAYDAYFADAKTKEERVKARVEHLMEERDRIAEGVKQQRSSLVSATAKGNVLKLEQINRSIKEAEIEKAQLTTEIEMLESAYVAGDEKLFADAISAYESFEELNDDYLSAKREVYEFAKLQAEDFERLERSLSYGERGVARGPDIEKLRKHYDAERIAETTEKNNAEKAMKHESATRGPRDIVTARHRAGPSMSESNRKPHYTY